MTSLLIQGVVLENSCLSCGYVRALSITGHFVYVFEVSAKISTLGEGLMAHRTVVGPLACMLAEVIAQVTALLEDTLTIIMHAFEIEFDALGDLVLHLNSFVPLLRNAFERPGFDACHDCVLAELRLVAQVLISSRADQFLRLITHFMVEAIELFAFFMLFISFGLCDFGL